ncbi:TonB-dependent receptor domain-containing protein [Sphingomonas sp. BK345]|uniref:TonB-dependent receptor domain-containing protein n=1 Tax=Sphingomonas sp. BK345 TaxID=2586980 RepID=UPI00184877A8|nr:TonB-dependent receptor [Sphingomonas sp. BK345]MBB3472920.1 outer membrane receptor protein involved in Fe transport [Sphingomonas sp. BK345]
MKTTLLLLASASALLTPGAAFAQAESVAVPTLSTEPPGAAADAAPAQDDATTADITVTGSRLASRGYSQPTPTTTVNRDDIEKLSQPNLFQAIRLLPALQGSSGRQTRGNSTSSGQQGLSSFALRGLGELRTLTLLDGQRVTPANFIGVPDISQFPQLLVERVDVVTGGASASYGSDAVGGVVNFVTNKRFTGVRANLQTGITTYGDDPNLTAQVAWGGSSKDGRLHVQVSGEYSYEGGTPAGDFGVSGGVNRRDWYNAPAFLGRSNAATVDGLPRYTLINRAQPLQYAKFGLITSGPLQGTAFGPGGVPYQFAYGSGGRPLGNGQVTGCFNPFCVGGDLSAQIGESPSLASRLERGVGYGRVGFDVSDGMEVFATATLARVLSRNFPNRGAERIGLTVQCDNAFLPAAVRDGCAANGITSFQFGTVTGQFADPITVRTRRDQQRYVLGVDGKVAIAGTEWRVNAYGAHGVSTIAVDVSNISLQPHFNAAIDAVTASDGSIVCRSAVARAAGCVPFNAFGDVTNSAAAYAFVMPENGPRQRSRQEQNVASFNLTGEPFSTWAGPVAIAFGVEGREEIYRTVADPYGNGASAATPNSALYPADPLLNTTIGNNWYAGNYKAGRGRYGVKEAYAEINVPILDSDVLGEANVNGAIRVTDYTTSGTVEAWKIGGVWKTPLDGFRLRAVTSRDVRAPNLSELFAAQIVTNSTVLYRGNVINIQNRVAGNTGLRPEIGRSTEIGFVYAEPSWLPGFAVSVDYYDIKISDAIISLGAQQIVDLCEQGAQDQCAATLLESPTPGANYVQVTAFNAASIRTKGFDIEASYRFPLSGIGLPGRVTLRGLATHVIELVTTSNVVGSIPIDTAGVNSGTTPDWKGLLTQSWDTDRFSLSLTERFISDGVYSNEWIECRTSCPVSTNNNPTVDDNSMPGAFYVDLGGSYNLTSEVSAFFRVDNLLDKDPVAAPSTGVSPGVNSLLYDVLGRTFRLGVRANF